MNALLVACRSVHVMLALTSAALAYTTGATAPQRITLGAVLTIPVLLAAGGIWQGRTRSLRGFAVLLVAYIGLGTVEVLATGGDVIPSIFLGTAVGEFTLSLVLLRRPPPTTSRE